MLEARSFAVDRETATWQGRVNGIRPPPPHTPHHVTAMRPHGKKYPLAYLSLYLFSYLYLILFVHSRVSICFEN